MAKMLRLGGGVSVRYLDRENNNVTLLFSLPLEASNQIAGSSIQLASGS